MLTPEQTTAIEQSGYADWTSALTASGWQLSDDAAREGLEIWKKSVGDGDGTWAVLVFQDTAVYPDKGYRQIESVGMFAKAEGLSMFEAIALLTGVVPWASESAKMAVHHADGTLPVLLSKKETAAA